MKRVGIVGAGDISDIYLQNLTEKFNDRIEIAGICDLVPGRAESQAEKYNVKKVYESADEIISDPTVDIVLNLTRPSEHYAISKAALNAGKHVYSEKPLCASLDEGIQLYELAKEKGLLIGGAADTFLGSGIQTCVKLIDDGVIGDVVGASAFMVCRGHETWHPDPEFYYKRGGGPMMDMGPYYLTALISMIGAVKSVTGVTKVSFPTRTITSKDKYGTVVNVDVPTYITGIMEFASGAVGTIFTTFDVHTAQVPRIEVYGSKGTINVPDPNTFGGPVQVFIPEPIDTPNTEGDPALLAEKKETKFEDVPLIDGYSENSRGLGLYDMVKHIEDGTPLRTSNELLLHVLEIMTGFERAYERKGFVEMNTSPDRPTPM